MNRLSLGLVCVAAVFGWVAAQANVNVTFVESAPKDRFVVTNAGDCGLQDLTVEIDLSDSAGGLIFDTTGTGAGVEVFQPFELRSGELALVSSESVKDGDVSLTVGIDTLPVGESVSFTIDVDDTLRNSALGQIRVAGSEIVGGVVKVSTAAKDTVSAEFGGDSKAVVLMPAC